MPRHKKRKKHAQRARLAGGSSAPTADRDDRSEHAEAGPAETASRTIELREEQLVTGKQVVEAGAVQVRTDVVSEQRMLNVTLTREEVFVDRRSVDSRPANRPPGGGEVLVDIPEYGQEVSLRARPIVTREVIVGKETVHETRRVTATLRREEARVESSDTARPDSNDRA